MKTLLFLLFGLALHAESLITLNVEPSKEHPRNSEGSFATLASGRVIFIYSQFYGGNGDESPARLVKIHSDDQGRTWSAPVTVVENTAGNNVMSVSLLRLASGKLAMFYCIKNSWIAQQMGVPILVYGLSANAKRLDTWDRLLWPRPFARGAVVIPEPIPTSKSMDSEELRLRVENALKAATARADELAGLPPDTAPPPESKAKPEEASEADAEAPSSSQAASVASPEPAGLEPRAT